MGQLTALLRLAQIYWADWAIALAFSVIGAGTQSVIEPYAVGFDVADPSIALPHKGGGDLEALIFVTLALLVPLGAVVGKYAVVRPRVARELHHGLLGFATAIGGALLFQGPFVPYVGRLRPDFLARCQPELDEASGEYLCTGSADRIEDGRRSFFSLHATLALAAMVYLAMFLAGVLRTFDGRGHMPKAFATLVPVFGALLMAATQYVGNRHHVSDIVLGIINGTAWGILGYVLFFHLPWEPRAGVPRHVRDEYGLETLPAGRL